MRGNYGGGYLRCGPAMLGITTLVVVCQVFDSRCAANGPESSSLVSEVRLIGTQFLDNPVGITGADGATSTVLGQGRALWVFGDTVEGPFDSIHGVDLSALRSNTAAIVPHQNVARGIRRFRFLAEIDGRRPRQIVPYAPEEDPAVHRIWPIHGIRVGEQVYLFYHRITLQQGVDVFADFQLDGMGIARADVNSLQFTRLVAPDGSREFWKGDEPGFGVFVERDDEFIYLWGCLMTGMYLARTRPESIEDLSAYEYLVEAPALNRPDAKVRWSRTFQPTAVLFDSVPNEMSAAYNSYLRKHVAFHSWHRERRIVMRTASSITGPWSDAETVYSPEKTKDDELVYAVKEHPELARENGRMMYVTFVNSAIYIPQLIEVALE
jgi:hypothetical protein